MRHLNNRTDHRHSKSRCDQSSPARRTKKPFNMASVIHCHYNDVIMGAIASQITSLTIVYSIVNSHADQRKHQSAASLAFVRGIHRGPVNSPHKWPVTRKMFPFDDVIMVGQETCIKYFVSSHRNYLKEILCDTRKADWCVTSYQVLTSLSAMLFKIRQWHWIDTATQARISTIQTAFSSWVINEENGGL